MARPPRNNVDYFPFYCEEGKKMYYLEEKYGNDGFATFVKILRELAKTDYHYLDLSKKTTMMFLSAKCKVSIDVLESIINDLVDLEKFNSELWVKYKVIWCQDFVDSIQDAYKKRSNECVTFEGLGIRLEGLGVRKPSKCSSDSSVKPQTKLNYTKEEEIRVKEIRECYDKILPYFPESLHPKKGKEVSWLEVIDKLNRIDKLTFLDIEVIVKAAREDNFWAKNFLSVNKLRKKNGEGIMYYQVFIENFKQSNNGKSNNKRGADPEYLKELLRQHDTTKG